MKKTLATAFALALAVVLGACASTGEFKPGPGDMLTEAETTALTTHARNFIAGSKKIKLDEAERRYMKTTPPETLVRYTGCKQGQLSFSWQLSDSRKLIAMLDGDLLSEGRARWQIQIAQTEAPVFVKGKAPVLEKPEAEPEAAPKSEATPASEGK